MVLLSIIFVKNVILFGILSKIPDKVGKKTKYCGKMSPVSIKF